ncbi:MAG: FprA family A-type flavoprotein [Desulfovibrionaceae bacterium]|nr:FprA family A-type flavoprotein [Desulfovibrionaceae bacterium]
MQPIEILHHVWWIGAVDGNKRNFHGYSRSPKGTTYNAYLIQDEKNVIFDTVDEKWSGTMLCRLAHILPLEKIDYIVVNHTELDHSGSLPLLVEKCHPEKIFVSPQGKRFLDAQFDTEGWPVEVVKTGDSISIGQRTVQFIQTPMLHWPDSMFSYIPEDRLLISNDAFGQNIASTERFADAVPRPILLQAVKEYYGNIVLPFSPQVLKTLEAVASLHLDIETIAPDHGLIWRGSEDCDFILNAYRQLAEQKPQARALIVFDTMWNATERMARAIASGFEDSGIPCTLLDMRVCHHSDVMTALTDCGAVVVGSSTHNNNMLPQIADVLTYMGGLRPANRIGAAFGSYGWSGEAPALIQNHLAAMKMDLPEKPLKIAFSPKHKDLAACHDFGARLAQALKLRCELPVSE